MNQKGTINLSAEALVAIVLAVAALSFGIYAIERAKPGVKHTRITGISRFQELDPITMLKCSDWHVDEYPVDVEALEILYKFPTLFEGSNVKGCEKIPAKILAAKGEGRLMLGMSDSDVLDCMRFCADVAKVRDACASERDSQLCRAESFARMQNRPA